MATVNVIIDETGQTTLSVEGCAGPSCKDLTRAIEQALGAVTADTPTPDMQRIAARPSSLGATAQSQGQQQQAGAGA